jgi:type IV pilus assembly protein PilE
MARNKNRKAAAFFKKHGGFTLIELMVVVAIVGILAMIALPSYDRYVVRSNRAVAKQFLLAVANKQEQYILDARQYAGGATAIATLGLTAPPELVNRYDFSVADCAAPCTTYTIIARAKGSQLSDGHLYLDNLGTKTPADKW